MPWCGMKTARRNVRNHPNRLLPLETTEQKKVLVLGIGNILMNDEGVGIAVVTRLEQDGFQGGFRVQRVLIHQAIAQGGQTAASISKMHPIFADAAQKWM